MESASKYRLPFCIMYDITDSKEDTFVQDLKDDWTHLVDDLKIAECPPYLEHNGKPLLAVWGLGFKTRQATASQANDIITYFRTGAPENYQVTLFGGVPSNWRTPRTPSDGDSKTDDPNQPSEPKWLGIYRSFDVLSPWTVGDTGADNKSDRITQDRIDLENIKNQTGREIDYMPVVFPGYSYRNAGQKEEPPNPIYTLNQIPRDGGRFWWKQFYNAINAGCTMIYGAMFDEVNEGTAMFKLVADEQDLPTEAQGSLVYLNIDGENLSNDWYLRLATQGGKVLRGEITLTPTIPPDT